MKELTPKVIELLEEYTDPKDREEILQAFEDGWYGEGMDRKAECEDEEECEKLGYCKKLKEGNFK